jgi:predicted nucleic acid-binding protein
MFVDTNVLVFASAPEAPNHAIARNALSRHAAAGERLCVSRQVLREFIAVVTRPQLWAQPIAIANAAAAAASLIGSFDLLEDGPAVWSEFTSLCTRFAFGGRQVHDANIVATMLAHGEHRLLTFNMADFARFTVIEVIVP